MGYSREGKRSYDVERNSITIVIYMPYGRKGEYPMCGIL